MKCGARGFPPPDIIWTLNGILISNAKKGYFVAEDGTLFVEKAEHQARLIFKCTAKNSAGSDEKEYTVKTISPPVVTKKGFKTINATEGDPSLLLCEIEGDIPEIYWYKYAAYFSESSEYTVLFTRGRSPSELLIHEERFKYSGHQTNTLYQLAEV
ncbi:unnamed protein product [Gongylonema pulchrum]|uniref:Ig-like domain-containing protein n=1 Tax=Gongylonema pulchrum TaxID=637853 RepID=A0A3P6QX88_9BILA|nr:unnamed protein product [Gongylonema pulchrum]